MSERPEQTLGQKIDALLEPLYAEADQHRATIALATEQQQSLQVQIDDATQGLSQIESRMAEVVRNLAQQDAVMAAALGEAATKPADQPDAPEPTQAVTEEPEEAAPTQTKPAVTEPEPVVAEATPASPPAAARDEDFDEPEPEIELDPEKDAEAVGEAAALLDAFPAEEEGETTTPAEAPKPDLTSVAERAAEAARKLREKAATE